MQRFLSYFLVIFIILNIFFSISAYAGNSGSSGGYIPDSYYSSQHDDYEGLDTIISNHRSFYFYCSNDVSNYYCEYDNDSSNWSVYLPEADMSDSFSDSSLLKFLSSTDKKFGHITRSQAFFSNLSLMLGIFTKNPNRIFEAIHSLGFDQEDDNSITVDNDNGTVSISSDAAAKIRQEIMRADYESKGATIFFPNYVENLCQYPITSDKFSSSELYMQVYNDVQDYDFCCMWRAPNAFLAFNAPEGYLYLNYDQNVNFLNLYKGNEFSHFTDFYLVSAAEEFNVKSINYTFTGRSSYFTYATDYWSYNEGVYPNGVWFNIIDDSNSSVGYNYGNIHWYSDGYGGANYNELKTTKKGAHFVIWKSLDSLNNYLHSSSDTYITSSYDDSNLQMKIDDLNKQLDTSIEDILTEINNSKSDLSAEELQKLIDKQSADYLSKLQEVNESIEDVDESVKDVSNKLDETNKNLSDLAAAVAKGNNDILDLLKTTNKINDYLPTLSDSINTGFKTLDKLLQDLLSRADTVLDSLSNIENYLSKILSALTNSDSGADEEHDHDTLYMNSKEIYTVLSSMNQSISSQNDDIGKLLGYVKNIDKNVERLTDLQEEELKNSAKSNGEKIANKAKSKFPSSVPWDLYAIYAVLAEEPQAPSFTYDYSSLIGAAAGSYTIVIDCSKYQPVSSVCRGFLSLTFIYGLVQLTIKLFFK